MECVAPVYRPRDAEHTVLHQVIALHLEAFLGAVAEAGNGAGLPQFIEREFRKFLACGVYEGGVARFRCEGRAREHLVPFSCKGRGWCPSCGGRRMTEWPDTTRAFFQAQRSPAGEDLILQKNLFIEYLLPLRNISHEAMEVYRRYYRNPGPTRQPMLAWTRDLPIGGEPEDVVRIVDSYARWLSTSPIPKLFIDAKPGGFLIGAQREFCRAWPSQETVMVEGSHFLQEDSPQAVGTAIARFVAKVLAGQIA